MNNSGLNEVFTKVLTGLHYTLLEGQHPQVGPFCMSLVYPTAKK
jgi:hypothetical protein